MYFYGYLDVIFLFQCLQSPDDSFDIRDYITFSSHSTCSGSFFKISIQHCSTNRARHFYFNCVARLWNALPPIDLSLFLFWAHFIQQFDSSNSCTCHFICPGSNSRQVLIVHEWVGFNGFIPPPTFKDGV